MSPARRRLDGLVTRYCLPGNLDRRWPFVSSPVRDPTGPSPDLHSDHRLIVMILEPSTWIPIISSFNSVRPIALAFVKYIRQSSSFPLRWWMQWMRVNIVVAARIQFPEGTISHALGSVILICQKNFSLGGSDIAIDVYPIDRWLFALLYAPGISISDDISIITVISRLDFHSQKRRYCNPLFY